MNEDDLYVRYQTLTALVGVLVHDLRNPLHSGSLLIEAMGSRTQDQEALRGKLRVQLGKLESLISEAAGPMKELAIEPRLERAAVDSLCRDAAVKFESLDEEGSIVLPPASSEHVLVDSKLFVQALVDVVVEVAARQAGGDSSPEIVLGIKEVDGETVRVAVGAFAPPAPAVVKAPFAIAGGGVRLALARALLQNSGATIRLEQPTAGSAEFAIYAPKKASSPVL